MKIKLLSVTALFAGMLFLTSFKAAEKTHHLNTIKKQTVVILGTTVAPNGDVYQLSGTLGTGYQGEDTVGGAFNETVGATYTASGHTYPNGGATWVTCTVYNPNGSVKAHINALLNTGIIEE